MKRSHRSRFLFLSPAVSFHLHHLSASKCSRAWRILLQPSVFSCRRTKTTQAAVLVPRTSMQSRSIVVPGGGRAQELTCQAPFDQSLGPAIWEPLSSVALRDNESGLIKSVKRSFSFRRSMSFYEEFHSNIELLPNILQKKYALLRDLDRSLQEILRQNEQRCEHEIRDIKRQIACGNLTPEPSRIRFSDDAIEEQKHSIRIADEKVALASQAYDLVDAHIQQLDQYLRNSEEEIRREREIATASGSVDPRADGGNKIGKGSESGRGGRKKTRLASATSVATPIPTNPTSMDLDLPVDPNEPTYCVCNQVSYGEMVACDNPECKIEWFHFGCVGLKDQPKGSWYCPDCSGTKRRRRAK